MYIPDWTQTMGRTRARLPLEEAVSSLRRYIRRAHLELAGQNFGFELAKGVTQVELEPETDYYYMEVRLKEES